MFQTQKKSRHLSLAEWQKAMKEVVKGKPKPKHLYICNNNIYLRYEIPKGEKNAGHNRWARLTSEESIRKYMEDTNGDTPIADWLEAIQGKPIDNSFVEDIHYEKK